MTVKEKLYAGENLTEDELKYLAWGDTSEFEIVDTIYGENDRWTRGVSTILQTAEGDLWELLWDEGLTEMQPDEFYYQPYRVVRKERVVTEVYYEKMEKDKE